jgi:S1-C subfamily serine protease
MWLFKFCSFLGVSLFVFSGVAARDLSDMQFRFDSSNLMPSTSQGDNSDPLNIMSASAAARSMSYKDEASKRGAEEASIYQKVSTGTVLIATDDGLGAGAVITNNGHILTNQHVVGSSQKVKVFFKPTGGSNDMAKAVQVIGTVLKVNTKTDLALIKVEKYSIKSKYQN